eukprot:6464697-Amphidinium_carterae.1
MEGEGIYSFNGLGPEGQARYQGQFERTATSARLKVSEVNPVDDVVGLWSRQRIESKVLVRREFGVDYRVSPLCCMSEGTCGMAMACSRIQTAVSMMGIGERICQMERAGSEQRAYKVSERPCPCPVLTHYLRVVLHSHPKVIYPNGEILRTSFAAGQQDLSSTTGFARMPVRPPPSERVSDSRLC